MTTLNIPLPDQPMTRLKELAAEAGVSPEEFVRAQLEKWLAAPDEDFAKAAAYVLKKNAELYRRLA